MSRTRKAILLEMQVFFVTYFAMTMGMLMWIRIVSYSRAFYSTEQNWIIIFTLGYRLSGMAILEIAPRIRKDEARS